jgi:hypothetical protein
MMSIVSSQYILGSITPLMKRHFPGLSASQATMVVFGADGLKWQTGRIRGMSFILEEEWTDKDNPYTKQIGWPCTPLDSAGQLTQDYKWFIRYH